MLINKKMHDLLFCTVYNEFRIIGTRKQTLIHTSLGEQEKRRFRVGARQPWTKIFVTRPRGTIRILMIRVRIEWIFASYNIAHRLVRLGLSRQTTSHHRHRRWFFFLSAQSVCWPEIDGIDRHVFKYMHNIIKNNMRSARNAFTYYTLAAPASRDLSSLFVHARTYMLCGRPIRVPSM